MQNQTHELYGVGLGLRSQHYADILETQPPIPWFEILSDNYLTKGGLNLYHLDKIAERYPIAMHSVGMSLGSTDPINWDYFKKLKKLSTRVKPVVISDHVCWISVNQQYLHELMPLPYTEEVIKHVVNRIQQIQDFLGCSILIENVSSYMTYKISQMTEWEFITRIAEKADCNILLDINNIYVSANNHHFDPVDYLTSIQKHRVKQFHLAGFDDKGDYLLDSHGAPVCESVWDLYLKALNCFGPVPTLLERDNEIPALNVLIKEMGQAQRMLDEIS